MTDFNRLRWATSALQLNPALRSQLVGAGNAPINLVDSTLLLARPVAPRGKTGVVLWDGLNSLLQLRQAYPSLEDRAAFHYLVVGMFEDVAAGFPDACSPLFPATAAYAALFSSDVAVPAWVKAWAGLRARLRPYKNAYLAHAAHRQLQAGGCLVFCGLVRPSSAVLDGFVRGTSLEALRPHLRELENIPWDGGLASTRAKVVGAYDALREARPQGAADMAAAYSLVSVMHRVLTLAAVHEQGFPLMVNEFGVHRHFDPYAAAAYHANLFIDFGSTRGPDLVYPRTVDLIAHRKPMACLRFLTPGTRLEDFLLRHPSSAIADLCEAHASSLVQQYGRAKFERAAQ